MLTVLTRLILICVVLVGKGRAEVISYESEQKLINLLKHVMECREIPGLTLTLVRGKEYKTIPMGVANRATGEKVTPNTLFFIGAITQTFTATLLAEQMQRSAGVLHFDTPISQLIGGEFQLANKQLTESVTLRDALTHRTGISPGSVAGLTGLPKAMSRLEVISHLKELPQQAHFRDDFQFNQFMYTLAAYVGEKISASSWEKLMRTHILDKLLMSSTVVAVDDATGPEFARSYVSEQSELVGVPADAFELGPLAPSGTMYTNAEDMAKALKLFLADPYLTAQVRIPPPVLEELMTPRFLLPLAIRAGLDRSSYFWPVPDFNVGYGMGFFRNTYRGKILLASFHAAYRCQMLTYYITDLMLGFEPWINETSACTFPEPFVKAIEFPNVEFKPQVADYALAEYQGTFSSKLLGDIVIRKSATNPKALTMTMGKLTGTLHPEGGNVFRLFLEGAYRYMQVPVAGKHPIPFARVFFDFKSNQCVGLKLPDSVFGGNPVDFPKTNSFKEEL
uniref:Beta-lactamase-related domain-containing protein n=1 Tax=Biomphalaria glabrata TaxID=6526 RepID=A0A2C9M740_BIOGL